MSQITETEIVQIEFNTRGQTNNEDWILQRSLRLTSTNFYKICTTRDQEKMALTLLRPQRDLSHVKSIDHGKKYEPVAVELFEAYTGFKTTECGMFVAAGKPFLSASPDRIIQEDACVEVKCPFTAKDQCISPETVEYLYLCDTEGVYKLKPSHSYYYQIQGQLFCANKKKCYFLVYTLSELTIIEIERDEEFIRNMLRKLEEFYNSYFEGALLKKYFYKCC